MNTEDQVSRLRDVAAAYPEDIFPEFTPAERKEHSMLISRASGCMGRFLSKHLLAAADALEAQSKRIAELEAWKSQALEDYPLIIESKEAALRMVRVANDRARAAEAKVARLREALIGLDAAYCRAAEPLSREQRNEDRQRLIAARAALKDTQP